MNVSTITSLTTFISPQDYKSSLQCIFYIVTMTSGPTQKNLIPKDSEAPRKTLVTHISVFGIRFRTKVLHWDEIRSNGDQDCFGEILDEVQVCTFTRDPGTFGNSCWCHSDPEIWSPRENRKGLELFGVAISV